MNHVDINKLSSDLIHTRWDKSAIKYINKKLQWQVMLNSSSNDFGTIYRNLHAVGSNLYTKMLRKSKLTAQQKLELILWQLGASIDHTGFLQLGGNFHLDPLMPPHSGFLRYFRNLVQKVFPGKALKKYSRTDDLGELANKIHLFRSYLDFNNIQYIRSFFKGKTDYERLLKYEKKFCFVKLDYKSAANFHNRFRSDDHFKYPQNMKVQVTSRTRMSEFIINLESGNFVSEWIGYGFLANGTKQIKTSFKEFNIVNTESFNYGIPLGGRKFAFFVDRDSHNNLDISHPHDPLVRRRLTQNQKQSTSYYWKFEESYYKKDGSGRYRGQYADIVKNGYKDYYAWNSVREKDKVYQRFVVYCRSIYPKKNPGFYYFLRKKEKFF
ncbi:DUF3114 domain-containing protein [Liquorilactobacillus mali]|uniref:DUF3114 domain-containing protein n=1 Tax=Liquorilactobacillus mali TaxID=1618 RepID=UPI0023504A89|nr:DUF3114 domain-containing protein [Liquorilactobacillus mali]MDC7952535.1 DUF3114 domain-containing protein [Liquorilactobacillus mali]